MPRLIDADDLLMDNSWAFYDENGNRNDACIAVENAPTVDAEPVVRCKDCKWYEIEQLKRDGTDDKRYKPSVCVIGAYAEPRKADWYCADGERREDGNNDRN